MQQSTGTSGPPAPRPPRRGAPWRWAVVWLLIAGPFLLVGAAGLIWGRQWREAWEFHRRLGEFRAALAAGDAARGRTLADEFAGDGARWLPRLARTATESAGAEYQALAELVARLVEEQALPPEWRGGKRRPFWETETVRFEHFPGTDEVLENGAEGDAELTAFLARQPAEVALVYCAPRTTWRQARCLERGGYPRPRLMIIPMLHVTPLPPPVEDVLLPPASGAALARALREALEGAVAATAALALPESAASAARLAERLLGDESPLVRWAAAERLGGIVEPSSCAPLLAALREDEDPSVRLAALKALGRLGRLERRAAEAAGVVAALDELAEAPAPSPAAGETPDAPTILREQALLALIRLRSPRGVPGLLRILRARPARAEEQSRWLAADALLSFWSPEVREAFSQVREERPGGNLETIVLRRLLREHDGATVESVRDWVRRVAGGETREYDCMLEVLDELEGRPALEELIQADDWLAEGGGAQDDDPLRLGLLRGMLGILRREEATPAELLRRRRTTRHGIFGEALVDEALWRAERSPSPLPADCIPDLAELLELATGSRQVQRAESLAALLARTGDPAALAPLARARARLKRLLRSPSLETAILELAARLPAEQRQAPAIEAAWTGWREETLKDLHHPPRDFSYFPPRDFFYFLEWDRLPEPRLPAVTDFLLERLTAETVPVARYQVVGWLGSDPDPRVAEALLRAAERDAAEEVRRAALEALVRRGEPRVVPLLREARGRAETLAERCRWLTALARLGERSALDELLGLCRAADPPAGGAPLSALGSLVGEPGTALPAEALAAARAELRRRLADPRRGVRVSAVNDNPCDTLEDATRLAELAAGDRAAEVREAALERLESAARRARAPAEVSLPADAAELRDWWAREGRRLDWGRPYP